MSSCILSICQKIEWTIRTNRLIFGPKYASVIRIFDSNGNQVLKVNTLKNQAVTIGENELSFVTYFDWKEKESYHVEFDRGAVTASEHCQNLNLCVTKISDVTPPVIKFLNSSSISPAKLIFEWMFDKPVTTSVEKIPQNGVLLLHILELLT
ncbi:hypothetical protein BpHYR1_009567 [Brachionus plicatilis]|uniref:Uncharacterized protein n=1 Tax=Brachionus plicatilis TaxID=10195 RepID=A0A3M7T8M7_BRAPC|nr:hypothetical protein BpHYR1_009567 [Brachionus plicatilis]